MCDLNELKFTNQKLEQASKDFDVKVQKIKQEMENKYKDLETLTKDKDETHARELKQLKVELREYEDYKKENQKLNNMLYQLYNKLIQRLKLSKDIIIDEKYNNLNEKDFEANLFDNREISDYIDKMLVTSSEELSSKMLRETIAYANMMLRTYLKEELKKKFNPVETFKEIKNFIDSLKMQLTDSENNRKKFQKENYELNNRVKKLENELKYKAVQFEGLKKKFDLRISERILKSRELRNEMIKKRENKRSIYHKSDIINEEEEKEKDIKNFDEDYTYDTNNNNINNDNDNRSFVRLSSANNFRNKKNENKEIFLTENDNDNTNKQRRPETSRKKNINNNNNLKYERPKSSLIGYYLTHNQFFKKENFIDNEGNDKDKDKEKQKEEEKEMQKEKDENFNINYINNKYNIKNYNSNKKFKSSNKKQSKSNEKFKQKTFEEKNNHLSDKYNMLFKDMIIGSNKDKIIKTGGFNVLPSHSGALKNLVDQTNNLFLYKKKRNSKPESKNIFNNYERNIENKFKILRGIKPDFKTDQYEIGDNIVSDIDNMIKNLEKKNL